MNDEAIERLAEVFANAGQLRHAVAHGHISHFASPVWGYSDAEALTSIRGVLAAIDLSNHLLMERRDR